MDIYCSFESLKMYQSIFNHAAVAEKSKMCQRLTNQRPGQPCLSRNPPVGQNSPAYMIKSETRVEMSFIFGRLNDPVLKGFNALNTDVVAL